jgi:transcriptional regulator with XRE-family HTH domain
MPDIRLATLMVMPDHYTGQVPEPLAARIAANLRALRAQRALSVVELAKRSGVARATLTKLEAGAGNPTVDTLYALADTLGASLGDIIGESPSGVRSLVLRANEGTRVSGAVSARLVDRVHGHRLAEIYDVTFAPRRRTADPHPPGVIESLILTEGRLLIGPATSPSTLGPGDYIRFPGDVPHLYEAIDKPAQGILVMSHP